MLVILILTFLLYINSRHNRCEVFNKLIDFILIILGLLVIICFNLIIIHVYCMYFLYCTLYNSITCNIYIVYI